MNLDDVLARLEAMPAKDRAALQAQVMQATAGAKFVPSPGPQTEAWFSQADVLLYGGAGGGGKSGLLCGLALCEHHRSLLMRRRGVDLHGGGGLIDEVLRFHGGRDGFSGAPPPTLRTQDGRVVTFGGANAIGDEQAFQGRARDLLGIDEAAQFAEIQVRFLMGWVRSTEAGQRCRTVLASNPPMTAEGQWLIGMFRPWLDVTHHNPAQPGELRWFVTDPDGKDLEVDGPQPVEMDGRMLTPQSRTFIPAALRDNPFLVNSGYEATLDSLPEPIRSAVRDGNFMAARQDDARQVIPSAWVRAAVDRWRPEPPAHAPMCALGVDVAQGGQDFTVLSARYDGWFAPLQAVPGKQTPDGPSVAGLVVAARRNGAVVVIDMGGGYGGSAYDHLKANGVDVIAHKGAGASVRRTKDQQLGFFNKRAEVWWRLREALDPSQDGGSPLAMPDDPELIADLTAPTFDVTPRGVKVETKDDLVKRIGRSPDRGDAVVMAWSGGPRLATHGEQWRKATTKGGSVGVNLGRHGVRRGRR